MTSIQTIGKKLLLRSAALGVGILFGLAVAEVGLRIVGYSSPQFYVADSDLGYTLIPGLSGWYTKEGRNFVTINSEGFNDAEHDAEKPEGVFRIAVIGDSYVEALQVGRDEAFTRFIADAECGLAGGRRVEVLSFGVSGYGTAQELLMFRNKVRKYAPDTVLLLMTTNNDITDNSAHFKKTPIPYFVLRGGELEPDNSFRDERGFRSRNSSLTRAGTWLENRLRVVQAVREISRWAKRPAKAAPTVSAGKETGKAHSADVGIDNEVYREPTTDAWQNAWLVTEALVLEMKREAAATGATFVLVTGSNGVQVLPNVDVRRAFAERLGVPDLFYPDRRLAEFGRANSISVITLAPFLAEYSARQKVDLHGVEGNLGYGHWNRLGHRVAGEEIARRLCGGEFE